MLASNVLYGMHIIIPNVFGVSFLVYDVAPSIYHKQCSEHKLGGPLGEVTLFYINAYMCSQDLFIKGLFTLQKRL